MNSDAFNEIADRIESAIAVDDDLARDALQTIYKIGPARTDDIVGADLNSTDRILTLIIETLPGWTVSVKGKAWYPNGHWTCTLRKTTSSDNDEFIGRGHGPTLPHALLAALFRAAANM